MTWAEEKEKVRRMSEKEFGILMKKKFKRHLEETEHSEDVMTSSEFYDKMTEIYGRHNLFR